MVNKPRLDDGAMVLARAYAKLSTCRTFTAVGIGPIPIDRVWEWLDRKGIRDPRVRDHAEAVLSAIDASTISRANRPKADAGPNIKTPPKSRAAPPRRTRRP